MALRHKGRILLITAISSFGCLSATVITSRKVEAVFGKAVVNRDVPFHLEYFDTDYPVVEFHYRLYHDQTKEDLLYISDTESFHLKNYDSRWTYDGSVSKDYTKAGSSFYFVGYFYAREDKFWLPVSNNFQITAWIHDLEGSVKKTNPTPNTVVDVNRVGCKITNGALSIGHDAYYVGDWTIDTSGNLYHGINLSSALLGYCDAFGEKAMTGLAFLRVYTNPREWNIGELIMANGEFYRNIPLEFAKVSEKTVSGRKFRLYAPSLGATYAVHRSTLKMYSISDSTRGAEYFQSNDLFIPIRNGWEKSTWKFRLSWINLNEFEDEFNFDFNIKVDSRLFGNCAVSEYCVGLGNE